MPDGAKWIPMSEILTYEEIERICREAVRIGITRFKITGGEPLVRKGCADLIRMTSTGKLKACLCYADTISVFEAARHGSEEEIRKCLEQAIRGKPKMHHFEEQNFITEQKNMSQIGG